MPAGTWIQRLLAVACMIGSARAEALTLSSSAFQAGAPIPKRHTCDGANQSPPLRWQEVPAGTKSWAVIADDPDAPAGTWVHWVIYDLPPGATDLTEGVPVAETLPSGAKQGVNDFHHSGYGGPCPPPGEPHHYVFTLYALDGPTHLQPRASKAELLRAIQGHVLGQARLTGTYGR